MPPIARVFISYQRDPSFTLALLISEKLRQHNIEVFVDAERLDSVGPFPKRLLKEIENSDVFVCLLANTTLDSDWVLREIDHAYTMRRPMIPVFQQTYVAPAEPIAHSIAALLENQGVHIFEKKGVLVGASIEQLAQMVKNMMRPSRPRWLWALVAFFVLLVGVASFQIMNGPLFGGGQTITPPNTDVLTPTTTPSPAVSPTPSTAEWVAQGDEYAEQGDYDGAITAYSEAITLDSSYTTVFYKRGDAYAALGDVETAIGEFTSAIELDPASASAYMRRGDMYLGLQDYEQAIADYTQALTLDPNLNSFTYYNLGDAHAALGDFEAAINDFTRAIELDPTNPAPYIRRGDVHSSLGRYDAAIADFDAAIEIDPNSAWAYNNRAYAYGAMGDLENAIASTTRAIELDPNYSPGIYNERGRAYLQAGNYEAAIADFEHTIQRNSGAVPDAYVGLGDVYDALGDLETAIQQFTYAIELDPNYVDARIRRADVYSTQGNYDAALADYTAAIEINPNLAWGYNNRAYLYGSIGDWESAIADFTRAIELDPNWTTDIFALRADAYLQVGNTEAALADYRAYLDIAGENADPAIVQRVAELEAQLATAPESVVGIISSSALGGVVRSLPTSSAEVLGFVVRDMQLPITGISPDGEFYRVDFNGQVGWIDKVFVVEVQGDLSSVPIVNP